METSLILKNLRALLMVSRVTLFAAIGSALCLTASAENVNLIANSIGSGTGGGWSNTSAWSNGQAPSAANDYFTNGFNLSTEHKTWQNGQGSVTFGGNSLTINSNSDNTKNSEFILKANIVNIANLRLAGGIIRNSASPSSGVNMPVTMNLTNLHLEATAQSPTLVQGSWGGNDIIFKVQNLTGDGFLRFASSRNFTFDVASATSFTGGLDVASGVFIISGQNLGLNSGSFLMETAAQLVLNNSLRVAAFSFGGTSLAAGAYSATELNAHFGTTAFSGTGQVQVAIPEASASLWGGVLAGCGLLVLRRRLRRASASR